MGAGTLLPGLSGDYDANYDDEVKIRIAYEHGSDVTDVTQIPAVITAAETATGTPVPRRRARLGTTNLHAMRFHFEQDPNRKQRFVFDRSSYIG